MNETLSTLSKHTQSERTINSNPETMKKRINMNTHKRKKMAISTLSTSNGSWDSTKALLKEFTT